MLEQLKEACREVGEWAADGNTGRGAVLLGSATLAALWGGWRWLRGGKRPPERAKVTVDVPKGQNICVQIGEWEDDKA